MAAERMIETAWGKENKGAQHQHISEGPRMKAKAPASRGEFETAIGRAESGEGDLLKVWTDYTQWARCLPENNQVDLLRRACNRLEADRRLHQDIRFLRLWVSFAEKNAKPAEVLANLEARRIGTKHALLFEALANCLEAKERNFEAAADAYRRGMDSGAQPQERLRARRDDFDDRMRQRAARLTAKTKPERPTQPLELPQPQLPSPKPGFHQQTPQPSEQPLKPRVPAVPEASGSLTARPGALRQASGVHPEPRATRVHFQTSSQAGPTVASHPADPGSKADTQGSKARLTCRKQAGGREAPRGLKRAQPDSEKASESDSKEADVEKFYDVPEQDEAATSSAPAAKRRRFGWFAGLFGFRRGEKEDDTSKAETVNSPPAEAASSAASAEAHAAEAQRAWAAGLEAMGQRLLEEREMEGADIEIADVEEEPVPAKKRSRWLLF